MKILIIKNMLMPIVAASEYPFLRPLVLLKDMFVAAIALVGTIYFAKNVVDLFAAVNAKDSSGMWDAGLRVLGSAAIAGIGWILTFLGFE